MGRTKQEDRSLGKRRQEEVPAPAVKSETQESTPPEGEHREELLTHRRTAADGYADTQRELDKTILTVASGGLAISLGFVEKIVVLQQAQVIGLLVATWGLLALGLISGLFSHRAASQAHLEQLHWYDQGLRGEHQDDRFRWLKATNVSNWISLGTVISGVICFLLFAAVNVLKRI